MIKMKIIIPTVLAFALIASYTVSREIKQRKDEKSKSYSSRISKMNFDNLFDKKEDIDIDLSPKGKK
jgi:hypothetical protein